MNEGKKFERDFLKSVPEGVYSYRLKDGGGWSNAKDLRFTPSNDYDVLLYSFPLYFALEMKSTGTTSLQFDSLRDNQLEGLKKAALTHGVVAGVVANFRKNERTFFVPIALWEWLQRTVDKKSFNVKDADEHSLQEIKQTIIRTRYRYDLEAFVDEWKDEWNQQAV